MESRLSALPDPGGFPLVTVILAVRDEERFLERALEAVLAQEWPRERLEVLVVDGGSLDRTRDIVRDAAARDPRVRLLGNPRRIVAAGLNVGLAAARGEVVVRVDGHCRVPPGYVAGCVALLGGERGERGEREERRERPECAGGPVRAVGETAIGRAIAAAMSTPFGVGGASFRYGAGGDGPRAVEHLPFGAWRRATLIALGGFDERLRRNQDDELSDRLRRSGGRIVMDPRLAVDYWCRATLSGLWRQYLGYGYWKVHVIHKRGGRPSSLRHLAPAALVVSLAVALAAGLGAGRWEPLGLVGGAYLAFLAAATASVALRRRQGAALVPLALVTMQIGYGVGFLVALPGRFAHSERTRCPDAA